MKPKYNILKTAGSLLGFKHNEETKLKMSLNNRGDNNPMYGKIYTIITKERISLVLKGKKLSMETRIKLN